MDTIVFIIINICWSLIVSQLIVLITERGFIFNNICVAIISI